MGHKIITFIVWIVWIVVVVVLLFTCGPSIDKLFMD